MEILLSLSIVRLILAHPRAGLWPSFPITGETLLGNEVTIEEITAKSWGEKESLVIIIEHLDPAIPKDSAFRFLDTLTNYFF